MDKKGIFYFVLFLILTFSLSGESVRSAVIEENAEMINTPSLIYKIPTLMYDNSLVYLSYDGLNNFYEGNIVWNIGDIMFGVGMDVSRDSLKKDFLQRSYNGVNNIPYINVALGKSYSAGAVALSYNLYSYLYSEGEDYLSQNNLMSVSLSADKDMDNAYFLGWGSFTWGSSQSTTDDTEGTYGPSYLIGALYKSYELSDEIGFYFKGVYKRDEWSIVSGGEETAVNQDSFSIGGGIVYSNYEEEMVLLYINYDRSDITSSVTPVDGVTETENYQYECRPTIGIYTDISLYKYLKFIGSTNIGLLHYTSDEEENSVLNVSGNVGLGFVWNNTELDILLNREMIFNTIFSYDVSSRTSGDYPFLKVDIIYSF